MRLDETLNTGSGVFFEGAPIDAQQTPFQHIEVFDTPELGKLMRIDGANMVSERDEFFYHENLVHPVAIAHPLPRDMLVIGGGDGGSIEELLKHPSVQRVVLAELDGGVIEMARKHFQSVHRGALDDPRVEIRLGDGMARVRESENRFDLILLDLTDPVGPAEALYTPLFYADCQRALNDGGALVLHIGSPFSHPGRVRQSLTHLASVFSIVVPWFVHIPMYGATWGFASASNRLDPRSRSVAQVDALLAERHIGQRRYYNGSTHAAMLALPEYVMDMLR